MNQGRPPWLGLRLNLFRFWFEIGAFRCCWTLFVSPLLPSGVGLSQPLCDRRDLWWFLFVSIARGWNTIKLHYYPLITGWNVLILFNACYQLLSAHGGWCSISLDVKGNVCINALHSKTLTREKWTESLALFLYVFHWRSVCQNGTNVEKIFPENENGFLHSSDWFSGSKFIKFFALNYKYFMHKLVVKTSRKPECWSWRELESVPSVRGCERLQHIVLFAWHGTTYNTSTNLK